MNEDLKEIALQIAQSIRAEGLQTELRDSVAVEVVSRLLAALPEMFAPNELWIERAERISDLELRCEELQRELDNAGGMSELRRLRIAELERENAELRKDAERYRIVRRGQHWSVVNGIGDYLRADKLDAAIDAALAAKEKS